MVSVPSCNSITQGTCRARRKSVSLSYSAGGFIGCLGDRGPPAGNSLPVGLIDGNSAQVVNQLIAIASTIGLSVLATFVILKFVDLVVGVRVSGEDELRGLDLSQHSEEAYSMEIDLHPNVHAAHEVPQQAIASAAIAK